jgi:O-antigen/teichoic acid export membrane protein
MTTVNNKTIAKNAGVMLVSQIITWVLALLLTLFLPRYLGPEGVGKYQLAGAIWAVMSIIMGFGMDVLQTKEIARNNERGNEILSTTILIRFVLYFVCLLLVNIFVQIAQYPQQTIEVINLIGISTLIWQISGAFGANLQAYEQMGFISLSDIISKAFITVISIAALLLGYDVIIIAWINIFSGFIAIGVQVYGLNRNHPIKFVFKRDLIIQRSLYAGFWLPGRL